MRGVDLNTAGLKQLAGMPGEEEAPAYNRIPKRTRPPKNWIELESGPRFEGYDFLVREKGLTLGEYGGDLG
jgi:hypothetical protein